MDFLKKLFGKGKDEPEELHLEFENLHEWSKIRYEKEVNAAKPLVSDLYSVIANELEKLRVDKKTFLTATPIESADKKMGKIADSNRDVIVDNLEILDEKIPVPHDNSIDGAYAFYIESVSHMDSFLDNTRKSMLYTKSLYPPEYNKISGDLANLNHALSDLFSTIEGPRNKLDLINNIFVDIEDIHDLESEIMDCRDKIGDLENKYTSLDENLQSAKSDLEKLINGSEYPRAETINSEIDNVRQQALEVEADIKRMFTPLSKALSRIKKQDENGIHTLSPQVRNILGIVMKDPVVALDYDLDPLYDELILRLQSDSLGLKDKKKDKTLEQVHSIKNSSSLKSLYEDKKKYDSRLEKLSDQLDQMDVYRQKTSMEKDISKKQESLVSTQDKLDDETKRLKSLEEQLENTKSKLISHVNDAFEEDIKINFR
ncbi:coiled-coil domain-containing protein [Methanohalophilus sp.]